MSEHASWELAEGEAIAPDRIALKPLGGGNRYEVYLVWDERLYSLAVAKLLRPDQADDEKALRDLGEEAEVLRALAHPVLIRSFDAVLEGPRPHVLIEHLEGPSLRRLIKRGGALPLEQALPLALHVAGALQYMAQAGYVHLDVKPDNIVMGVPPRLIDLSIARDPRARRADRGPDRHRRLHGARAVRGRVDRGAADRAPPPTPGASARPSFTPSAASGRSRAAIARREEVRSASRSCEEPPRDASRPTCRRSCGR